MSDTHFSFLGRLRVGGKLTMIPALFIFALAGILIYTIYTLERKRVDAVTLDLAGRQRLLIERYVRETLLASQGYDADYTYTHEVLKNTLQSLIHGGQAVKTLGQTEMVALLPAPNERIREELYEQMQLIEQLEGEVKNVLTKDPSDPLYAVAVNQMMLTIDKAHFAANDGVKLFTAHSESKFDAMIRWEISAGILVGLLGIVFSWYVAQSILNPLAGVVKLAQGVSEGNLRQEPLPVQSQDEIGQLTVVINEMMDRLREMTGQTRAATEGLNSSSAEILASTQQQASSASQQAAAVQQTSTTMKEISESGAQISERSKEMAVSAEAVSTASDAGLQAVIEMGQTMERIQQQAEAVAGTIVTLSERTQAVEDIISTVNDIAEQSNLLSLNASIEATAAGEYGQRFGVVAEEMKNLADRAKDATVQVRTILQDIQKGINSSVMLTEEAVKRIESGKKQSDIAESTIQQMTSSIQESVGTFQQIIGATNQQQIGFEQVAQALRDIQQATEQTASGTTQLERAVLDLNTLSQQLQQNVERFQT